MALAVAQVCDSGSGVVISSGYDFRMSSGSTEFCSSASSSASGSVSDSFRRN